MLTTIPFFIPDTSPIFTYTSTSSSLSNTYSNSTSTSSSSSKGTDITGPTGAEVEEEGGWIAAYSPIGNGYDQTFHYGQGVISGNFSGASVHHFLFSHSPFYFHVHRHCVRILPKADRQWDGDGINSVFSKVLHIFEIIQFLCGIFVLSS